MSDIPAAQGGPSTPTASTNTSSAAAATQEVLAGDSGPTTFDDLDLKKGDMKKATKEVKDEAKAKGDKEEKSEAKASGKKEAKDEVDGKAKKEAKPEPPKSKALKYKSGDKEAEIDELSYFAHKVDGKEEAVTLRQLLDNYSGQKSWDKKFSKLDLEQKNFKSANDKVSAKVKAVFDEQDPEMRFYHMAELSGKDPIEVRQKFLEDNIKLLEKWHTMSDDERKADAADYKARVLQHRNAQLESQMKAEADQRSLDAQIQKLSAAHKFTREDFETRQAELVSMKEQGRIKDEVTPQFVAETLQKESLWKSADETLKELGHEFQAEDRARKLYSLVEMAYMEGIPVGEISDLVKMTWPKQKSNAEIVQEKVQERTEFYEGPGKASSKTGKPAHEALLFDDL